VKNGGSTLEFKDFPFRVLMIFKTAERRNNIALRLLNNVPPILTLVCLATLEEVTVRPFDPIWVCPASYRPFVDSEFGTAHPAQTWAYRRQSVRVRISELFGQ